MLDSKDFLELVQQAPSAPALVGHLLARVAPRTACFDIGSGVHGPVGQYAFELLPQEVALHAGDLFTVRELPLRWRVHCPLDMRQMWSVCPKGVDWVQTFDTLEHIPKEDGEIWLDAARHAARAVFVFVPTSLREDGFVDNAAGEAHYPDNPYQKHLSGWTRADFVRAGYECARWRENYLIAFWNGEKY